MARKTKSENLGLHVPKTQNLDVVVPDYDQIIHIETEPCEEWFEEIEGPYGEMLVYLNFQATGFLPNRIGPFASRDIAVWVLDQILKRTHEALVVAHHLPERLSTNQATKKGV